MAQVKSGRLIVAAILAILVYGMIAAMLGTLLPSFNLTPEQSGNVAFAQALGLIIASVAVGPLIDSRARSWPSCWDWPWPRRLWPSCLPFAAARISPGT